MVDICIQGVMGRMGAALTRMIGGRQDCRVCAGIDIAAAPCGLPFPVVSDAGQLASLPKLPDVLIDFSTPSAARAALEFCARARLPCVVCTTGLSETDFAAMRAAAEETAVFYSANMSLGVNLLAELARRAAAALPGFDIEIVEKHHRNKVDAPSGTAVMLADTINEGAGGRYAYVYDRHSRRQARADDEIGICAVRGGGIVGEHDVIFAGANETVTVSHAAASREVFADGAIAAALFMAGKARGMYSMRDLMEEK